MEMRRFEPREACAVEPRAFGALFGIVSQRPLPHVDGHGIAHVSVCGALEHRPSPMPIGASYVDLEGDLTAMLAEKPRAVVLRINSPGGVVSGCFETARALRAQIESSGVPVIAYVDGQATSAAYALACVADEIVVPPTGVVGSIGVIDAIVDATRADEKMGVRFHVVTSGARKADGNPHTPTPEEALADSQARVDDFASIFFELVAERRGLSVDAVRALEAGTKHGAHAVAAGLADKVETFTDLLARISASGTEPGASAPETGGAVMATMEEAKAALKKAADEGDEKAKKALAAFDEEPKQDEPEGKAEEEKKDEPEGKAEEEKKDEPEASASATILSLSAKVARLEAAAAAKAEAEERQALLASRPDLPAETVAWLKTQPVATVKGALASIPKIPGRALGIAATAVVPATQGNPSAGVELGNVESARARLGIQASRPAIEASIHERRARTLTPSEARAELARRNGGAR